MPAGARDGDRRDAGSAGPGRALFDALARVARADLPLVAEDLGVITPAGASDCATSLGLPGMLVLQFGFDPTRARSVHRFENHADRPGRLHGNPRPRHRAGLVSGRWSAARSLVDASLARHGVVEREPWWGLIRLAFASPARVAMMQAQDVLGLGSEARMNDPARVGRQLALADAARGADAGAGAAAAGGDRGVGAAAGLMGGS